MADRLSAIDAFFDQEEEARTPTIDPMADLRAPDEVAQERVIAEEVGQPPQAVRAYPELFSQSAEQGRTRRATQGSPRLQAWLDQPDNYAVARDDVENLSVFERLATHYLRQGDRYRAVGPSGDALATQMLVVDPVGASAHIARRLFEGAGDPLGNEAQRQGDLDVEHSALAYRAQQEARGRDALTPAERQRLDELATREGQENWGPFIIGPTRRLLPQMIGGVERGFEQAGRRADEVWDDPLTLREGERWNARRVLEGGAAALVEAPAVAVATFGGAAGGYFSFGYEMETGIAFDSMVRQGIDPAIAAERAEQYGGIATAIEYASTVLGFKLSGVGRLGSRLLMGERVLQGGALRSAGRAANAAISTGAEQAGEESLQEYAQIIHQDLAAQDQANGGDSSASRVRWSEVLTPDHIEQILQAGYIGFQGGLGMGAVPAGANLALDMRSLSQADRAASVFEQWTRAAQASRLNERGLASTMESAIGAMDESNVYIDAERFTEHFQGAGVNAYAVAEELGIGEQSLQQALASHGQVEIPTARFAARVLRVPAHARLAEHARIAPDASTPAEVKADAARIQADVETMAGEMLANAETDNELGQTIEARMRELFSAAQKEGGPRAEVSARYARIAAALPRALVARARQTNPDYAAKLEQQFRTLFGEGLDVAGPGRELGDTQGAEVFQRGKGPDAGPVRNDAWSPPEGVRISERARKIAEMAANGASNEWIANEMESTRQNVSVTLDQVKKRLGGAAPWEAAPSGSTGRPAGTSLDRIVRARDLALQSGYPKSELIRMLADRFNTTPNNIKQRLWQHDKKKKREAAEADAQNRRSKPFDLHTVEGRQAWFEESVLATPIPGEASDARFYGFALDTGEIIVATIAPEPTGSTTVDWTFLPRLRAAATDEDVDLFGPGTEKLGVRGVSALMSRIAAVLEADVAQFGRDSYVYTPNNDALEYIYERLVSRIVGKMPYSTTSDNAGAFYLIRDGAEVLRNGTVVPSPENANAPRPDWPNLAPEEVKRLQAETYDRIERFAKEGADGRDRGDGEQADADGASADAGGRVPGTRGTGEDELNQGEQGSIRYDRGFQAGRFGKAVIKLAESSDLSTFLHEFGHLGHLVLESIATDEQAPAEIKAMWETTLGWWGLDQAQWAALKELRVTPFAEIPQSTVDRLTRQFQQLNERDPSRSEIEQIFAEQEMTARQSPYFEQWARSFEAYLMEGKAPSLSLREAFETFKAWLTQIYRSVLRLNANLTPEIRNVFDRLLATDAEIAEARAAMGSDFALSREAFKTEEEFQQYQSAIAEAKEAQEAELRARAMDAYARKSKRWWRGERERVRDAATRAVDSDPARRVEQWLGYQDWRVLPDTLSDGGEISYVAPEGALEDMPEGLPSMQLSPEAIAQDWPNANLPVSLRPRTDAEVVLAEAMALKAQTKGRGAFRAQRLSRFIKDNGGLSLATLSDADRAQFDGVARRRPGLINNASGKSPEEMMRLATEAGYFGEGAARELRQGPDAGGVQGGRRPSDRVQTFRSQGGVIRYRDTGDAWAIMESDLPPHLWGKGLGGQMYRDFIEAARQAGRERVTSDARRTVQADNVYSSLRRRGYAVESDADGAFTVSTARPDGSSAQAGSDAAREAARVNAFADAVEQDGGVFGDGLQLVVRQRNMGIDQNYPFFHILKDGKKIGDLSIGAMGDELRLGPRLDPEFRRQNIGTQLYQYVERLDGRPLGRSDNLTEAGAGLWRRLDRNRARPNTGPTHPGFELFQGGEYGANDRGAVARLFARLRKEVEFARTSNPDFVNVALYPQRLFDRTNEVGVSRAFAQKAAGVNWNVDPEIMTAFDALSASDQEEVIRELEEAMAEFDAEGGGADLGDAWERVKASNNFDMSEDDVIADIEESASADLSPDQRKYAATVRRQQFQVIEGYKQAFELYQDGELFAGGDKVPTIQEFLATLISDLNNDRQVYSARDAGALANAQALADAQEWFDSHDIDLSKGKEEIRAEIVAAIEKDRASENAYHPDDISPWFGFSSGDELIQALSALKPRNVAIEEEIDRRVAEEHGDAGSPANIQEAARQAAHAEVQAKRIEVELAALQKATGGRRGPVGAAAKAYAEDAVEQMTLREIRNADKFLAGERRAARAALEAATKKDWPEAERQKSKQLISFWLYKFATAAAENATRIEGRWKRYSASATTRAAIGPRHIEQIDAILDTIETGRPQSRPTQTLSEWAEELAAEDAADLIVFNPQAVEQQIKRPLAQMSYAEVKSLNDVLRNIETIGRGMIRLRNAREAQRIADIQTGLKERIRAEWADKLQRKLSLVAPNAIDKGKLELSHIHAQLLKIDYLARLLDGLKDGGPWMGMMAQAQDAENDLHSRSQAATQQFLGIVRAHYTPAQFREMLSKRIYIDAIEDNRTKAQIISAALNVGNDYNREALVRGEKWSAQQLQAVLAHMTDNDWTFVSELWNYIGQWKEESFALDERTRGSRPPEVMPTPFTLPSGRTLAGSYWPVSFDTQRSDQAAQREARDTVIGEYGGQFRQAATNRGRLKARAGTAGQALSSDFMGVLAKHVQDSLRDITHRELIITMRRVKADKELRNMIARVAGRDAVRALDEWVHRMAARTPANVFGDYGRIAAYLRRAGTSHAMGFKVSVATLNLLGHLQAIPRNGIIAQMKQAGLSVAVGFPDLLRRHLQAIGQGQPEVSARVALVYDKSEMMRMRRNTFDRDINEVKGDLVGRREGAVLPKQFEDTLQVLNAYTDQVVSIPTWLAAYESAKNGKVNGVAGDEASVAYADSVVRMVLSAGGTKDMAALIASNNQWQRLMTMFMGWASAFYNQMSVEQLPGVASGKISLPKFAANMVWIWLLPAVVTTIFYGQNEKNDDEEDWQYWSRMALNGVVYPLQTVPLIRDLLSALVQGYRPQTPIGAVIDRSQKFASALERGDERQMVKQGFLLAGQLTGVPAQAYVTGDYISDVVRGEEELGAPDMLEEALLRDTR